MHVTQTNINSTKTMPVVGLGTWKIDRAQAADLVHEAITLGYRHIDCACDYGNECEVGRGIRAAIDGGVCKREDLWVTSKLWNTYHDPQYVRLACERSLTDLGLDYIDLYLIHFPIAQAFVPFEQRYPPGWFFDPESTTPAMRLANVSIHDTWTAMEQLVDAGLVGRIGVSNFNTALLRELMTRSRIAPAVLQVEMHPYLAQEKLVRFCAEHQIAVAAFSPLGASSYVSLGMATQCDSVLENPVITRIAREVGATPAQVVLRWAVQRGVTVIPKSVRAERLRENLVLDGIQLNKQQMIEVSSLDCHRRFNDPGEFCSQYFNTFCPIFD